MKSNHTSGAIVDGKLRTINEFSDTDRKLDFRCPKCQEPLILKLRKTRNQSHFAHKPDSNCTGAQESANHLMAKEVLNEYKKIYFPEFQFIELEKAHIAIPSLSVEKEIERSILSDSISSNNAIKFSSDNILLFS